MTPNTLPGAAEAPELMEVLARLMPVFDKAIGGMMFTADRAGEVIADMNTLRAALATPKADSSEPTAGAAAEIDHAYRKGFIDGQLSMHERHDEPEGYDDSIPTRTLCATCGRRYGEHYGSACDDDSATGRRFMVIGTTAGLEGEKQ